MEMSEEYALVLWWSDRFEYQHRIAQLVKQLNIESRGSCSNPCLVRHYLSNPVTVLSIINPFKVPAVLLLHACSFVKYDVLRQFFQLRHLIFYLLKLRQSISICKRTVPQLSWWGLFICSKLGKFFFGILNFKFLGCGELSALDPFNLNFSDDL